MRMREPDAEPPRRTSTGMRCSISRIRRKRLPMRHWIDPMTKLGSTAVYMPTIARASPVISTITRSCSMRCSNSFGNAGARATRIGRALPPMRVLTRFEDAERGGFYFTAHDHERLPQRPKPWTDDAMPSGNGVAARGLLALGHLYGEVRWLNAAERKIRAGAGALEQHPQASAAMLQALEEWLDPPEHVVVRTYDEAALFPWRRALASGSIRRRTFFVADAAAQLPAVLAAMTAGAGGRPAAYRCHKGTCSPAIHDIGDFLALHAHAAADRNGGGRNRA